MKQYEVVQVNAFTKSQPNYSILNCVRFSNS